MSTALLILIASPALSVTNRRGDKKPRKISCAARELEFRLSLPDRRNRQSEESTSWAPVRQKPWSGSAPRFGYGTPGRPGGTAWRSPSLVILDWCWSAGSEESRLWHFVGQLPDGSERFRSGGQGRAGRQYGGGHRNGGHFPHRYRGSSSARAARPVGRSHVAEGWAISTRCTALAAHRSSARQRRLGKATPNCGSGRRRNGGFVAYVVRPPDLVKPPRSAPLQDHPDRGRVGGCFLGVLTDSWCRSRRSALPSGPAPAGALGRTRQASPVSLASQGAAAGPVDVDGSVAGQQHGPGRQCPRAPER